MSDKDFVPARKDTILFHRTKKDKKTYLTTIYRLDTPDFYYTVTGRLERVWNLIDDCRSANEIVQVISREYKVPGEECQPRVHEILKTFRRSGLINFV
jgi:hypothetical protein